MNKLKVNKLEWFNVCPDDESYSSNAAGIAIDRLKTEEDIKLEWAGKTRDTGYGEEHLYSVTGEQDIVDSIQVMFWDRCTEEAEEEANDEEQEKAGGKSDYRKIVKSYGDQAVVIGPSVDEKTELNPLGDIVSDLNKEFKVIRVSLPTHGYLMDHRTLSLKSMDSVIWHLIDDESKSEAKIKELEDTITKLENEIKERT